MKDLKDYVRTIPNFPKEGIMFRDITSVLQDAKALKLSIDSMEQELKDVEYDVIVAPESRGFIFGMPIAYNMEKAFVPVRKKGKLPGNTIEEEYDLEYGKAVIEIHTDSIKQGQKVVIIDDLLATGGTIEAIIKLVERLGGKVVKIGCLIELDGLGGRERLADYNVFSLLHYSEE